MALSFGAQAGLAGLSSIMDYAGSSIMQNATNVKNKRNTFTQLWMNKFLMDQQNEYNKPVNQMKRLEEAGLNPNLVYGSGNAVIGGASGSVSGVPSVNNSKMSLDYLSKMSMLNAMELQEAQTKSINTTIDISKAELELKKELIRAQIENLNASSRNTNASAAYREADNSFYDSLSGSHAGNSVIGKGLEFVARLFGK